MERRLLNILLSVALLAGLVSCTDDLLYDPSEIGEGETTVDATVYFKSVTSASLGTSRAAGDAIKNIDNLCVLLYDSNGDFVKSFYGAPGSSGTFDNLSIDQAGNTDRPADDTETSAEERTPKAKLRFTVDKGIYKIYAVANMGDIAATLGSEHTEADLKSVRLTWDNTSRDADNKYSVAPNRQMFGYFDTNGSAHGFDAPAVKVNGKINLFCWLRRAASKVTVAFDASHLEDGIRIHLKSVKIKHIPKQCYLGRPNTPGYKTEIYETEKKFEKNGKSATDELYEDGEVRYYCDTPGDESSFESWPFVSLGKPIYGLSAPGQKLPDNPGVANFHTELTPALYFYENLQGDEKTKPGIKDKRQDSDGDGKLDAPGVPNDTTYVPKDDEEFGTYIEVEAYYDARMSKRPGEGKIIYRFMLGKDIYKDYNAERNFHYKLTLVFNGYANDADWHIEYTEDKEMIVPNPYYVSYLYNQRAVLPVRLKGSGLGNAKLQVRIIENHWWPTIPAGDTYQFADTTQVYPHTPDRPAGSKEPLINVTSSSNGGVKSVRQSIWNGFLSLAENKNKIIAPDDPGNYFWTKPDLNYENWRDKDGLRTFTNLSVGSHEGGSTGDGYDVELAENGGINVKMPFFTRPKQLVSSTGYTGNNPFVAYTREAKLELRLIDKTTGQLCIDKNGDQLIDTISIIQVRRCVNPKGVWRSWDNTKSFHVVMKILPYELATKFETYNSKGSWRAHVEIDPDNAISLEGADASGYVRGSIDSPMDFTIKFNGKCADSTKVRSAIVLVEYNNYTCHHRIFVRQGYAPQVLNDASLKWHACNMYSSTEETQSPLEEGSMFKFGNWNQAILASNNDRFGFQEPLGSNKLDLAGGGSEFWSNIKSSKSTASFAETKVTNVFGSRGKEVRVRVATVADYDRLRDGANREFGYGVLYGDSATETLEPVEQVYGYRRGQTGKEHYGMRGCFVYNTVNGNNLFFPIGAEGFGRRKTNHSWYGSGNLGGPGSLQYSWRSKKYSSYNYDNGWRTLTNRPLFENINRFNGAIYWCQRHEVNPNKGGNAKSYLDVNYRTLDFNTGTNEVFDGTEAGSGTSSSACFIRCVEDVN